MTGHNYGDCKKCGKFHKHPCGARGKHWKCSDQHNEKISLALKGKPRSEEHRNKLGLSSKKRWEEKREIYLKSFAKRDYRGENNPNYRGPKQKVNCCLCGKEFTITKDKKRFCSFDCYKKYREGMVGNLNTFFGKHHSEDTKRIMSALKKGKPGRKQTEEERLKHSLYAQSQWKNPGMARRMRFGFRPSGAEKAMSFLLGMNFPGEWDYVGDGKVFFDGKNPDFINVNGKKQIIELFGDYWHSQKRTGRSVEDEERIRKEVFGKCQLPAP